MKKLNIYKTLQLVLMIIFTGICVYMMVLDPDVFHYIASNPNLRILCGLLWAVLAITFLFLFMDFSFFSSFKRDYHELKEVAYSDSLSGIPNRQRVNKVMDKYVDKYVDKELPSDLACSMIDITNLVEINKEYGRTAGDESLKAFSGILAVAGDGICFVGRNGGNKFIAFFEDGSEEKLKSFFTRIKQKVDAYNDIEATASIEYKYGVATQSTDQVENMSELIVLANKRVYEE